MHLYLFQNIYIYATQNSDEQLANHFIERFCTSERFVIEERNKEGKKNFFEQLVASKIFGIGPIGMDYAKDFDEMTANGTRTNMAITFFKIWARWILKLLFKEEFYVKGMGLSQRHLLCIH